MSLNDQSGTITSDDMLGLPVIDVRGSIVGVVERINIDPIEVRLVSITVDKGLLKKGLTIGRSYIERVTSHAVLLSIRPLAELKGMQVFDMHGALVGAVVGVVLEDDKNKIKTLSVRKGYGHEVIVEESQIATIGHSVLLNVTKHDVMDVPSS